MSQSNSQNIHSLTGYASAAISRRRFVRFTAADFVATQLAAATEVADGVATDAQATVGGAVEIQTAGICLMEAGAAITAPGPVTSDADGKAIPATAGDVVHGKALTTTAADAEMVAVLLKTGSVPAVAETAIVALTDSTGLSGTHDDTLAATAALVTLTDNTGGSGTHDDTLADGLTTTAVVGTFTGAVDGTVEDIAATASAVVGGATPTAAQVDTGIALAVSTIVSGTNLQLAELAAKIDTLLDDVTVQNQNDSDLAQKHIEVVAQLAVTNQNISDVAQKLLEIRTALISQGILA